MKCVMIITINFDICFGESFDMYKEVRIDRQEFLTKIPTHVPLQITPELNKAYETIIRRLKLK